MIKLSPEPIFFEPIYHEKVWGGISLKNKLNKIIPLGKNIGESWELSGIDPYQSTASSGGYKGRTLHHLIENFGIQLTGRPEKTFPLLFKYIDAAQKLSVQVHPNDAQAVSSGWGSAGKTECWYVIDAQKDAKLITGFNCNVNREMLLNAIEEKTIENLLKFVTVKPGEFYFIPAGTVHAILGDSLIYEIQQPSDTTLRFYDWNRIDSDKPRPLHINEALSIVDMDQSESLLIEPVKFEYKNYIHSYRIACRYFSIEEYWFKSQTKVELIPRNSMRVISVINGSIEINSFGIKNFVEKGSTVLLPFILKDVSIVGSAETCIIITFLPDLKEEIIKPLMAQNISMNNIIALGGKVKANDLKLIFEESIK